MTDRELLEAAAKAAGLTVVPGEVYHVGGDEVDCTDMLWIRSGEPDECDVYWNPLTDDGDAFRLAVKLGMHISVAAKATSALVWPRPGYSVEHHDDDPYTATRRAIVRAAAEIGSSSTTASKKPGEAL